MNCLSDAVAIFLKVLMVPDSLVVPTVITLVLDFNKAAACRRDEVDVISPKNIHYILPILFLK